jgi:hypothetical protein
MSITPSFAKSGNAVTVIIDFTAPPPATSFNHILLIPTSYFNFVDDSGNVSQFTIEDTRPRYSVTFGAGASGSLSGQTSWAGIIAGTTFNAAGIIAPTVTPAAGYAFSGWWPALPAGTAAITQSHSFTAQYTVLPRYTVTFHPGANGSMTGTASYPNIIAGTTFAAAGIATPVITPDTDYRFIGWQPAVPAAATAIRQNYTFTAQYAVIPKHTISFTAGEHGTLTGQSEWIDIVDNTTFAAAGINAPAVTPDADYRFTGWSPAIPDGATPVNQSYTFAAMYAVIPKHLIRFVVGANGTATGQTEWADIMDGATFAEAGSQTPVITPGAGYRFLGWSPPVPPGATRITAGHTFTAQFQPIDGISDAPAKIYVPELIEGAYAAISWDAVALAGVYDLERKLNTDAEYLPIYSGGETSMLDFIPMGVISVTYRVRAAMASSGTWGEADAQALTWAARDALARPWYPVASGWTYSEEVLSEVTFYLLRDGIPVARLGQDRSWTDYMAAGTHSYVVRGVDRYDNYADSNAVTVTTALNHPTLAPVTDPAGMRHLIARYGERPGNSRNISRISTEQRFEGDTMPTASSSEQWTESRTLSFTHMSAAEAEEMASLKNQIVVYRDHYGERMFGQIQAYNPDYIRRQLGQIDAVINYSVQMDARAYEERIAYD